MSRPIGIFDSGIGGLSVLRHIVEAYPQERMLYLADQAHVPYGPRSVTEIRTFSEGITQFLLAEKAKVIVVACNTASAAALNYLRATFPDTPFVGVEPAVKPAALNTRSSKVGVLATTTTFASSRYALLMSRFATEVEVFEDPCSGLVPAIEAGEIDSSETAELLRQIIKPMLNHGVDTLVLGCTHYPFVRPVIERIVQTESPERLVTIIDPAPAVSRQVGRVLAQHKLFAAAESQGSVCLLTTGELLPFTQLSTQLLGQVYPAGQAFWGAGGLSSA